MKNNTKKIMTMTIVASMILASFTACTSADNSASAVDGVDTDNVINEAVDGGDKQGQQQDGQQQQGQDGQMQGQQGGQMQGEMAEGVPPEILEGIFPDGIPDDYETMTIGELREIAPEDMADFFAEIPDDLDEITLVEYFANIMQQGQMQGGQMEGQQGQMQGGQMEGQQGQMQQGGQMQGEMAEGVPPEILEGLFPDGIPDDFETMTVGELREIAPEDMADFFAEIPEDLDEMLFVEYFATMQMQQGQMQQGQMEGQQGRQ